MWCLFSKGEESHCIFLTLCFFACIVAEHSRMTTAPVKRWRTLCLWERVETEGCTTWMINPGDRVAPIISAGLYREERECCEHRFFLYLAIAQHWFKVLWMVRKCVHQRFQRSICSILWPFKENNVCDLGFDFDLLMPTFFPEISVKCCEPFLRKIRPLVVRY